MFDYERLYLCQRSQILLLINVIDMPQQLKDLFILLLYWSMANITTFLNQMPTLSFFSPEKKWNCHYSNQGLFSKLIIQVKKYWNHLKN